jgi:nucleotide-binding universal stress UspA family protein
MAKEIGEALTRSISDLAVSHKDAGIPIETHLTEGLPHERIIAVAEEVGAELIVMGTHGRTGLAHLLVGSVAERVVRASPIPVLTVPSSKGNFRARNDGGRG